MDRFRVQLPTLHTLGFTRLLRIKRPDEMPREWQRGRAIGVMCENRRVKKIIAKATIVARRYRKSARHRLTINVSCARLCTPSTHLPFASRNIDSSFL